MAGYVKLQRTIWQDADFVKLSESAQRLYLLLVSQADISHVGILPLMPARWSRFSANSSPDSVRVDLDALAAGRFVVIDADTEELWVRSYLVHDEAWKLTNGTKSLLRAYGQVLSHKLRKGIGTVLATVGVTVDVTVGVSQQPAASSHPHPQQPAASSEPDPGGESPDDSEGDAAAAAIEILIAHKCSTARNPTGLRITLERELPKEHGAALAAYIEKHPQATAADLATHVLLVPGLSACRPAATPAWHADPACPQCAGDGLTNTADDHEPATYGPCPCRRSEPYPEQLATLTDIRPADEVA